MKKTAVAALFMLLMLLTPTASAEKAESAVGEDLFFTESEAENIEDIDRSPHPVVWVFVAIGAASIAAIGVLTYVNRRQRPD